MRRRRDGSDFRPTEALREIRADYDAANESRYMPALTGVLPSGSGQDYHYRYESHYWRMMERARAADRNNMVIGQGITRLVDNVLQDGLTPDPETGFAKLDAAIKARRQNWAEDPEQCDAAGEFTHHQQARLTLRAVIVDGDILHLPLQAGSLQAVEAHRLRTPRNRTKRCIVHGVVLDRTTRRRLAYLLTKDEVDPLAPLRSFSEVSEYPARDRAGNRMVLHIYDPKRVSQTRGVTALAPIMYPLGMHEDLQFANLLRAQVAACYAVFHEFSAEVALSAPDQRGERMDEILSDGGRQRIEGIAPGMEVWGRPGETLKGFSPNVPNPEFFQHAALTLSIIAINLDLPVQVFLLDPTRTNFSGWRGAIDQARLGMRRIQNWMIARFYRPVYTWKLRQWLASDPEIRARATEAGIDPDNPPLAVFRHRWQRPRWPYIEPNKDISALSARKRSLLAAPSDVAGDDGYDYEDLVERIVRDNTLLIETAAARARELSSKLGVEILPQTVLFPTEQWAWAASRGRGNRPERPGADETSTGGNGAAA